MFRRLVGCAARRREDWPFFPRSSKPGTSACFPRVHRWFCDLQTDRSGDAHAKGVGASPSLQHHATWQLALLLLLLPLSLLAATSKNDYRIDPDASLAVFRVRLLWLDNIYGQFTHVDGDVAPGPRPGSWVVSATIPVDTVSMTSSRMRQWVLAPSFFDAQHHPIIRFVSNPIAQTELDRGGTLTGYLTLRGVTAPVHFAMEPAHCAPRAPAPCRLLLRGNVQRSTFGMTSHRAALSDSVDLNLSITLQHETR